MFKKFWSNNIKNSNEADSAKMEITPFRDWKIILMVSLVGFMVSLGFNIYMSLQLSQEKFFSVKRNVEPGVVFNSYALSLVLENIAKKEGDFERIKIEGVSVPDPSL